MTESSPTSPEIARLYQFARDTIQSAEFTDDTIDILLDRIIALEEIVAAPWPRSWLLRRRLGRQLRAAVAPYGWVGPDFYGRRFEQMFDEYDARRRRQDRARRAT